MSRGFSILLIAGIVVLLIIAGIVAHIVTTDTAGEMISDPARAGTSTFTAALQGSGEVVCTSYSETPVFGTAFIKDRSVRIISATSTGANLLVHESAGYIWREGERTGVQFSLLSDPATSTISAATSSEPVLFEPHHAVREHIASAMSGGDVECFSVPVEEILFEPPALVEFN